MPFKDQEQERQWRRDYIQKRRIENLEWIRKLKVSVGCTDCGYKEHHAGLEFDHVSGNKKFNVSDLTGNSREAIEDEIAECEVVCGTCHNIRTWVRREVAGA